MSRPGAKFVARELLEPQNHPRCEFHHHNHSSAPPHPNVAPIGPTWNMDDWNGETKPECLFCYEDIREGEECFWDRADRGIYMYHWECPHREHGSKPSGMGTFVLNGITANNRNPIRNPTTRKPIQFDNNDIAALVRFELKYLYIYPANNPLSRAWGRHLIEGQDRLTGATRSLLYQHGNYRYAGGTSDLHAPFVHTGFHDGRPPSWPKHRRALEDDMGRRRRSLAKEDRDDPEWKPGDEVKIGVHNNDDSSSEDEEAIDRELKRLREKGQRRLQKYLKRHGVVLKAGIGSLWVLKDDSSMHRVFETWEFTPNPVVYHVTSVWAQRKVSGSSASTKWEENPAHWYIMVENRDEIKTQIGGGSTIRRHELYHRLNQDVFLQNFQRAPSGAPQP